ncbi:MAG: hypothetical protein MUE58_06890 [Chitinophagaceae bacterium]|nr:hypothetical protein [Chitinophagaceae bacterium]
MNWIKNLLIGTAILLTACDKDPETDTQATLLDQTLEFKVGKEDGYLEPIFDSTKTSVSLAISAENMQNGQNRVLWDTLLALRPLRDYPPRSNPIIIRKNIRLMLPHGEILRMSRNTRYQDRNNQVFQESKGETIPRNIPFLSVEIGL